MDDRDRFAEIEYEPDLRRAPAAEQALRFFSSVRGAPGRDTASAQPQRIAQRAADPIREKFFAMRSLASDRPFARDDSELFYRQAKFMEDFTDDYEGDAKFFMYFPYYQHMGYEQLRTYFTWRTKVRRGEVLHTATSYAFIYIYELLSGIGADDPADGLNKLVKIWDEFLQYGPALEPYMVRWFKDYHIYYELPHSFQDFVKEHSLQKYYSLSLILDSDGENDFELWKSISSYVISQSRFFKDGNEQLTEDCFNAVSQAIDGFCRSMGKNISELFVYKLSNRVTWRPFSNALFYGRKSMPDRKVLMPGKERYYYRNDRWTAVLPICYSNYREYAGYVLKKTEACLRQAVKYKYKLTAELKARRSYYKDPEVMGMELDGVIEKAVADFIKGKNKTVVTVDHANLARIRKEALGTQAALIVPDVEPAPFPKGEAPEDKAAPLPKGMAPEDKVASLPKGMAPEDKAAPFPNGMAPEAPGVWTALKEALTGTELAALSLALNGAPDLKTFADQNGVMLEVLIDGINEKAADYIGDNLIEMLDGVSVYDEYRENINEFLANENGKA